jgi:hypothetical protein
VSINAQKNDAQGLKQNGLERRVPRFCTICDKNQPLNQKKIEKVMAILVPRWPAFLILCLNFGSKSLYAKNALCTGGF